MEFNNKEKLLLKSLILFYNDRNNLEILLKFLKSKQRRLSLRLLDWLVTNYSKKHGVVITDQSTENNIEFMYLAYKNHLKSYSKKFFDAFARRERIFYTFHHQVHKIKTDEISSYYDRDNGFVTTIAQLNAFRFFISSGVIDYAIKHLEDIEKDMVHSHTNTIATSQKSIDTKPETNFQTCVTYRFKMTLKFG